MAKNSDHLQDTSWVQAPDNIITPQQDSGLMALMLIAKSYKIAADSEQLYHLNGKPGRGFSERDIIRQGLKLGLEAKAVDARALPENTENALIMITKDKQCFFLKPVDTDSWTLTDPLTGKNSQFHRIQVEQSSRFIIFKQQRDTASASDKISFSWFWPMIVKHRASMVRILLASIVIQVFALASVKCFQVIIDKVLVNRALETLDVIAVVLVVMALYEPVMGFVRSSLFAHLSSAFSAEMISKIYQHLLFLPMRFFQHRQSGNLIARIRELDNVRNFLASSALMSVIDLLFVAVFLGVMFYYASDLAWVVLATLIVIFIVWLIIAPFFQKKVEKNYRIHADNVGFLTESVSGIETIKSTATQETFSEQWEDKLALELNAGKSMQLFALFASHGVVFIQKVSVAILLWFGTSMVIGNELTVGELVAFNMLASHVTLPILRLAQLWQDLQQSKTSLNRLSVILDTPMETALGAGKSSLKDIQGKVSFRQVSFRYQNDCQEIITQLNLEIRAGECLGLTGTSGSGKSTLSKLMQKLYTPQSGQILIDDVDLTMADTATLRRQMGIVLQENILFNGSIHDNILLGNPCATEDQFQEAAEISGVAELVEELDQGYQTQVGERGSRLSGGQKQRVAIARALISNPKIVIFDEATSALDYESEHHILTCMEKIKKNRTLIVIAHRMNALALCDRIVVLSHGSIIEAGSHQELLDLQGHYLTIWRLQNDKK